jgi:NAD(P)-dependent dehydrogenase (short-subunit alcohol dehydrogenase family)
VHSRIVEASTHLFEGHAMDIGRVVLVGGTSGIGLATARAAADRGAEVVVVSARQASVDSALAVLPENASGYAADVRDSAALDDVFGRIGQFDHLVYTAGDALAVTPLADLDLDAARAFFAIRYFGALDAVRAAVPRLRAGGSVTLTGGLAAWRPPTSGWSVIASVCGAMESLTRALAIELAPIRVNLVRPGLVRTALWSTMSEQDRAELYDGAAKSLLVQHIDDGDEVALAYLSSMTQAYATGSVIAVDGGGALV